MTTALAARPAPSPSTVLAGTPRRHDVLRRLGSGGMADVFLARQLGREGFEKLVALKRLRPALAADPVARALLIAEARLGARLSHPNLVETLGLGEDGEGLHLALEYVPGKDLAAVADAARARGARLPVDAVVRWVADALAGLDHLHRARDAAGRPLGLVHRDVSPQNLLLSVSGRVTLGDLGVAAPATGAGAGDGVAGKYPYVAPERLREQGHDARSDLFSMGVVLHELLAGERPFRGPTPHATVAAILTAPAPDVRATRPEVPAALAAITRRALAKDPDARFGSAEAMQAALEALAPARAPRVLELLGDAPEADRLETVRVA
jgi:serine/threonine protein kinase